MLESIINKTIEIYRTHDLAIFHKRPLSINFSGVENGKLKIKEGWIKSKSTADYYGIYKGTFIAFEAKSTNLNSLPLRNIKDHQFQYLKDINRHFGFGFLIVGFNLFNEYFLITLETIEKIESKSLSIELARKEGYLLDLIYPGMIDFIPILEKLI